MTLLCLKFKVNRRRVASEGLLWVPRRYYGHGARRLIFCLKKATESVKSHEVQGHIWTLYESYRSELCMNHTGLNPVWIIQVWNLYESYRFTIINSFFEKTSAKKDRNHDENHSVVPDLRKKFVKGAPPVGGYSVCLCAVHGVGKSSHQRGNMIKCDKMGSDRSLFLKIYSLFHILGILRFHQCATARPTGLMINQWRA